jgi:hypothetical protein
MALSTACANVDIVRIRHIFFGKSSLLLTKACAAIVEPKWLARPIKNPNSIGKTGLSADISRFWMDRLR